MIVNGCLFFPFAPANAALGGTDGILFGHQKGIFSGHPQIDFDPDSGMLI